MQIAKRLKWVTAEEDEENSSDAVLPETLVDNPQDSEEAIDFSDPLEERDTSVSFLSTATNWDALLDTAGIPTDDVPVDPLRAKQAMSQDGKSGVPSAPPTPAPPGAQHKANQKRRAGRGVEGSDSDGPTNPMESAEKYNWDSFALTPKL